MLYDTVFDYHMLSCGHVSLLSDIGYLFFFTQWKEVFLKLKGRNCSLLMVINRCYIAMTVIIVFYEMIGQIVQLSTFHSYKKR